MPHLRRLFGRWLRLRRLVRWRWRERQASAPAIEATEGPLRAALYSVEQMEVYGRALARQHRVRMRPSPERLLERLQANERVLQDANTLLSSVVREQRPVTPAGEWLLDNYYLVEEQIQTARRHLPRGYSRQLPSLATGPSAGLPRVYELSMQAIAHGDGRIDGDTLGRFIASYQSLAPLSLGELWAVPIMLRLALLENLRRMAARVMRDGEDRRLASQWADDLNRAASDTPTDVVLVVADMARSEPPLTGAFIAELTRSLQGRGGAWAMPIAWLEQWAAASGQRIEELVAAEGQQQASDQVSISNSIGSLRFLSTMDWRTFVEDMSVVEQRLREDPMAVYPQMDFGTRDAYRHVVEKIARGSRIAEERVATIALDLARAATPPDGPRTHVGYWLVGEGLHATVDAVADAAPRHRKARRLAHRVPLALYLLPITLLAVLATWGLLATGSGEVPTWLAALLGLLVFSELGIVLVNWTATVLVAPKPLPKLDFSEGIPAACATVVAVPSMLSSTDGIDVLVEALEVRFLANRDPQLRFVLLTDFLDAAEAQLPTDDALLAHAVLRIEGLNQRYASERGDRFYLLHRPRQWNPSEGVWMGHERKRGKLAALNALLRHGDGSAFMRIVGDAEVLRGVRYVITLDSDTQLPRDAARAFVATLAHPLNRPRFDPALQRVVEGYGILQPSVGTSLGRRRTSRFARMFGSEPGIDPYTRMVSDVYQDLFDEGSFVGKGIYDVDAFEHALEGRLPENRILSHDLLEGCYARAGLVSDVRLYEDYPERYAADAKRRARWIRGDWQLLPWLMPWTPRPGSGWERNRLSLLSRGKLLDNLRRSLVPPAALVLLVAGWLYAENPAAWTAWVLALWFAPPLIGMLRDALSVPDDTPLEAHYIKVGRGTLQSLLRAATQIACLPYEALLAGGAVLRTLWRMAITRRHLLQWNPSSEVERRLGGDRGAEWRVMAPGSLLALALVAVVAVLRPQALPLALPFLLAWTFAPALMAWLGRPPAEIVAELSGTQRAFLGRLARRTWSFFQAWVREQDHWLPPDNIQEHPALVVARRTSPTNIGLSLLANLSAWDFGYLQQGAVAERTALTFGTLDQLPRHRGHFLNWYDTETLAPLPPRYVSTVDSGNLAGHLLTLRQGLLALVDAPVLAPHTFDGLADTLGVLDEERQRLRPGDAPLAEALNHLRHRLMATRADLPRGAAEALARLQELAGLADTVLAQWPAPVSPQDGDLHWPALFAAECHAACAALADIPVDASADADAPVPSLRQLAALPGKAGADARARIEQLQDLAHRAGQFSLMEYGFLFYRSRKLLSIGYNVDDHRLDNSFYDLLASEARLCAFVAIAQGELTQESWFALGRLLTEVNGTPTLLSWSGSMFEYLMPQLVMPSYPDTLLDQTARHAVEAQIVYGRSLNLPWGVSESGYNAVDARLNYQYRAFGVPGLGLKRGLGQDRVIAPYASMMALMVAPEAACQNLQALEGLGFAGRFGMYEAIDYTPARVPPGHEHVLLRSFMAHHQGMGLLSLDYLLRDQPMQRRFVADVEFQATLLLLQERIPRIGVFHPHEVEALGEHADMAHHETALRVLRKPGGPRPEVQLLSNGRYHGMLTHAGGGYSRHGDLSLTRWREDGTTDAWGTFCYLRDVDSGDFWSAAYQPTCVPLDNYEAIFTDAKAEFRGALHGCESHLQVAISAEDDIELRRLRLTNRSRRTRTVEITTYAEVVLAPAAADDAHPAFSNLFVQSEIVAAKQAVLCTRRPRSHDEVPPWMFHLVAVHDADVASISYETDRARFLGRGNTPRTPQALTTGTDLSGSDGSVLDPIVAIRVRVVLEPEQTVQLDMVYGIGADRPGCEALLDKYRDRRLADRVFDLAWTHSQVVRRQINATQAEAQLYERLASHVLYANPLLRAGASVLQQNQRGQSGLWGHAISGDLPIVLLKVTDSENVELVRQLVQAHAYWRQKGLNTDLVIWNDSKAGYRQELQDQILGMVAASSETGLLDRPGGIFVRPVQNMTHEDRILLQAVARAVISDEDGTLVAQVGRQATPAKRIPALVPQAVQEELELSMEQTTGLPIIAEPGPEPGLPPPPAHDEDMDDPWPFLPYRGAGQFDNGTGSFSEDGREYVVVLREGAPTPAPWANVIANARLGTVVSESAPGYTWFENAHEFRLTPWLNDPVSDTGGEAFYLRDEDTGRVWSPMPLPRRGTGAYRTRHGFGYTVYEHFEDGIVSELWVFVDVAAPLKYSVLRLHNLSGRPRRLSAIGYVEWVMGDLRAKSRMHVVTERDPQTGALLARNTYSTDFGGRMAFFDTDAEGCGWTCDRLEFIGRNGGLHAPAALRRERLGGRSGAGLDPCAALQVPLELAPGERSETTFRLGAGRDRDETLALVRGRQGAHEANDALDAVRIHWRHVLASVQVRTPDPALDALANGWLVYQTLGSRYLARSGYYQSGGAFGFRDQLQDVLALIHARPDLAREHLLLCAAHQFAEGDVMHWWHPPQGRGVRTRCSDDYLWLPQGACRYLEVTGDATVLDEMVGFIEGRAVTLEEESYYDMPTPSALRGTMYAHCVLALERGCRLLGERGIPLMGSGDWNDGMNRVGDQQRGESVWLGFFLHDTLRRFIALANARGDEHRAHWCQEQADTLRQNLEQHAWDGEWYRRAWFDNGTPLGSKQSEECRIDSISQSWSVLSGVAAPERAQQALDSLYTHLVRKDAQLIQLLDPPFDKTSEDPGYIRGYVPGVRENGGQYTHAAVWAAMAFAHQGDAARAWELAGMINPLNHALDPEAVQTYRVEPYVLAADVYAVSPHVGRGGWTWYTGSAGWMYRLLVESLLGIRRQGDRLSLAPCLPDHWSSFELSYRFGRSRYEFVVTRTARGQPTLHVDDVLQPDLTVQLRDDGHHYRVALDLEAPPG
ncbi:glycoside hydrolase family 94 protein [Stenotrophomonas sp. GbtcB23]|uniref:glycoside hydrolase family 94 protein n=1 Tax=Stenotrophomonas sp. GbtcB23 TaxID=2824768 RepID=UPI001C30866D|nr:glycoside hydrolase family 94 protein [Stenotrophomonas sp. GbtcB23]